MRTKKKKLRVVPQAALVVNQEFRSGRLTEGEVSQLIKLVGSVWAQLSVSWPLENLAKARKLLKKAQKRGSCDVKSAGKESAGGGQ